MNNFAFYTPTRYEFGRNVENRAGELIAALPGRHALVIYGGGSAIRSGLLQRVRTSLEGASVPYTLMGGIQPNPTDDRVYEGIETVKKLNIDCILAVGGGSVIDTAKAIAAGALSDGDFWDFFSGKTITEALPIGVVLTIPAAGSEGSGNAVITRREGLHKISIRTEHVLRPKFALLNPELTFSLPPYQTAAGIVDMMAHILERYFSPTEGTEVTDRLCEGLLKAIITEAPIVLQQPENYDARANIMWAGTLAHNGICGCGRTEDWVSHRMEHELSAVYGVTHGAGLAVVNPAWMTFMASHRVDRVAQLAQRVFNVSGSDKKQIALQGIEKLKEFYRSIGMPTTLAQLGIPDPDFQLLVKKLHENMGQVFGGYYPIDATTSMEIYKMMV